MKLREMEIQNQSLSADASKVNNALATMSKLYDLGLIDSEGNPVQK